MNKLLSVAAIAVTCLATTAATSAELAIHGSTTVIKEVFSKHQSTIETAAGVKLSVVGNGSSRGLTDLVEGKAAMAMISAPLEEVVASIQKKGVAVDPGKLVGHRVGGTTATFAVHPSNAVKKLSPEQTAKILSGEVKNWKDVGGADLPILVVTEQAGGGLRTLIIDAYIKGSDIAAAKREVTNATQVATIVAQVPAAIGIVSTGALTDKIAELSGGKTVEQPLILVTSGSPDATQLKIIETAKSVAGK